jgi:RNA polymerase sigma factor (sigma-70 family)
MKIKYKFVNGKTKEIEVNDELGENIKIIERIRKRKERYFERHTLSAEIHEDDYGIEMTDNIDLEDQITNTEALHKLHKAISTLNTEQQEIVYSVFFYGKELKEIAKEMGITYQSVQDRLKVILKKLKTFLEN